MPEELRRRRTMDTTELAPIAHIRETDAEEVGNDGNPALVPDGGIDDGFGVPHQPPTNGVPRRSPFPEGDFPNSNFPPGKRPLDVNLYATKKTVAQGMMDLALLTANANQLRYVLEAGQFGTAGANYYISVTLISISIIMQLVIGVALIFLGRYNVTHSQHARKADTLNNWVVLGVFIITVINVFISSFAIEPMGGMKPVLLQTLSKQIEETTEVFK